MLKKSFIPILFFIFVIGCSKQEEKIQLPARDFDEKIQIVDEFHVEEGIYQVVDNVYVAIGYALANSILIVGDGGNIIIDTTESHDTAHKIFEEFQSLSF